MKRIITYLYEYQDGMRRGSAGVFKLDLLGEECHIRLNLQGSVPAEEQGTVYFVVKHGEGDLTGVFVGETSRYRGSGGGNWVVRQDGICGSRYSFDDVHGMAVRYPSGRYLASCWEEKADERFLRGDFEEEKEETGEADERLLRSDFIEQKSTGKTVDTGKPDGNSETSGKTGRDSDELHAEELPGTASKETLQRMDISDIRSLPKKNWHLCSNSFLIHGFFSYHYLVRKDVEEDGVIKSYLGVPGIYTRAERAMAMLFGFPEFEKAQRSASNNTIAKEPQIPEGSFGYWFCRLEM